MLVLMGLPSNLDLEESMLRIQQALATDQSLLERFDAICEQADNEIWGSEGRDKYHGSLQPFKIYAGELKKLGT